MRDIAGKRMSLIWILGLVAGLAVVRAGPVSAQSGQMSLAPRAFEIDKFQCRDLVALTGEARDRLLIYYNGYLDGQHGETTWDERIVGQRVEEALRHCRDDPAATVQYAFTKAWSR